MPRTLRIRSSGDDVKFLQEHLNRGRRRDRC